MVEDVVVMKNNDSWEPNCISVNWTRAYSKRVPCTNCALRIKKCATRISSGIYFKAQVN